jgi:hypothetical protein
MPASAPPPGDQGSRAERPRFGAAAPTLGYLYQVELALLELMRRVRDEPTVALTLEVLDDIAFEIDDDPRELLQAKHRIAGVAALTDASTDLWKTLRVWASTPVAVGAGTGPALVLMTTSEAPPGSAGRNLRAGPERDVDAALGRLEAVAKTSTSHDNRAGYSAFLSLDEDRRRELLERVVVADRAPALGELDPRFESEMRLVASPATRAPLLDRLKAWWYARSIRHLHAVLAGARDRIAGEELELRIASLRDEFTAENLPIDYAELPGPTEADLGADDRAFVEQLRLIALGNRRLALAIRDHNRAFAQRSRWMREELLDYGELERYEAALIDEWEHHFTPLIDEAAPASDEEAAALGREVFARAERDIAIRIRPRCSAAYVTRGSLHMLADSLRIGWHPEWVARLRELLPPREGEAA